MVVGEVHVAVVTGDVPMGATPEQVARVKDEFAIYMVGDSRLNIAGLNRDSVPILARAIVEAGV